MNDLKKQIQRQLIANIIKDKCTHCEHIIFRDAWCTQDRVIRFATSFFRSLLGDMADGSGQWKTGDHVIYEVNNGFDSLIVNCVLSMGFIPSGKLEAAESLMKACGVPIKKKSDRVVLESWNLTRSDGDINKLMDDFDELINKTIPAFESDLQKKNAAFDSSEEFTEGQAESVTSNKYERNPKARAACLAHYGTSCVVCGMDFAKEYGPEFAGKIEVHHVVPISQIGKEYVVDPVKDLVPVCPNCHMALHSKPGGVYTVEELRKMRAGNA